MDICEDGKNVKRFKSDDGIVMMDPSLPRLFQMDQACRHVNRKGINILNYKQFITNLNNYLKDDLPNALSYIRVSLASIKKRHLKQIADQINGFLNPIQDGDKGEKGPPTSFSPVTFTNIGFGPKNFLTFSFNLFATLVQNSKFLPSASPKLLNLNQDHPSKKRFFW